MSNPLKLLLLITIAMFPALGAREEVRLPLSDLHWRNIGPLRGGRSIAATGVPGRPLEFYFGATGGGLWKSTDAGLTWNVVTDGQLKSSSVGAIAVSPSRPDVVYIGMGESELRGNVMQGDGVYRSVDAGRTWAHAGLSDSLTVSRLRVDPRDPELVYAAVLGDPTQPGTTRGVYRSRNGGGTWERILYKDDRTGAVDLTLDPANPRVLYAALWQVQRVPWQLWSGGPGSGLFKSTDGGDTWTDLTGASGLPGGVLGKIGITVSGADSRRLYAVIEAQAGGLYRSDDGGHSWKLANGNRDLWQRSFYFNRVVADPVDRDRVFVLNFAMARSSDAGATYTLMPDAHADYHDLWIDPAAPNRMIEANDGGAAVTVNGGRTWTAQQFPTAQLYRVETTSDFPYHVTACQQDNTSVAVPSIAGEFPGVPGAPQGAVFYDVGGGESGWVAPHPAEPGVFFAGSTNALTRFDRRTGQTRDVQPWPRIVMGEPARDMPERWNWTYPVIFSPLAPHDLYVGSQHVWRSRDEGLTWSRISPDLTRADPKTLGESGGPILGDMDGPEVYATVLALAPSRLERETVWTGSDDGLVHVTRDGGKTWQRVTPPGLPEHTRISVIEASPHAAGRAFVAARRNQLGDRQPYLFKTDDYGATWVRIDATLPREDFTHVVREDPARRGLLYAGTEHGVYVSFDEGGRWLSLSGNLPDVQVPDLKVEKHDLVIATHGRSFWILDSIAPLRQWQPGEARSRIQLFKPEGVYRRVAPARIDLLLAREATGLAAEILDAAGAVVQQLQVPDTLAAGHHRFTWNLHTVGAALFPGMVLEAPSPARGVVVPPGDYQVRVTAGGVTATQGFTVLADPRLADVTAADYAAQYALALHLRNATSLANRAVIRIRAEKARLGAAPPGDTLAARLAAIEARIYQVQNRSPKDKIAFPIRLNDRLAGLLAIVDAADAAPTAAERQVAGELINDLEAQLSSLDAILRAAGLAPLR
ncbi:MAG: glycosyl hydrolase [Vicinamibacterales bacterium]